MQDLDEPVAELGEVVDERHLRRRARRRGRRGDRRIACGRRARETGRPASRTASASAMGLGLPGA